MIVTSNKYDDPSIIDADEVAKILGVDVRSGLTSQEAARRLAEDGPNELRSDPPLPAWRRLLSQFQDPLIYLLLAAVVVALFVWGIEGLIGWPVDAIVIMAIVVLNGVLGYAQEAKARERRGRIGADDCSDLVCPARRARACASPAPSWCGATCSCLAKAMPSVPMPACSKRRRCACWRPR